MSRWDEKFKSHPVHATLKEIDNLLSVRTDDITSEGQSEKRRMSKLLSIFEGVLNTLDPELTPYQILDSICSDAGNIQNELTNYNSNKDEAYLRNANDYLDRILTNFSQLFSIAKRSKVTKPAKKLEKLLDESIEIICDKKQSLENEILEVSKLSQVQNEKLKALSSSIDEKQKETDDLISAWRTQCSNEQNERNSKFAEDQQEMTDAFTNWKNNFEESSQTQFDQLIKDNDEKLIAEQEKFSSKVSNLIEEAEDKRKEILELHGLVAGESVASGYLENAKDEKKQADSWRRNTIIFIALTVLWLVSSYAINIKGIMSDLGFYWELVITTIPLTGVLLFGAAYSAKQSSLHRQNEIRTRWFSLEMMAIGPFIESLPVEERNNLKKEMSERLFGQQYSNTEKETLAMDGHTLKTMRDIIDMVKPK